jgi:signal transduction histidine kinase/ligand-binding sensor domain-containing protein
MFVFVCLISISASAQTPRFPMEYYTTEDGLPDLSCNHMIQDQLGYIWVATNMGLSRYDGFEFVSYQPPAPASHPKAIGIQFIWESRNGDLWLGSEGVMYQFDRQLNTFNSFPLPKPSQTRITSIYEDSQGVIWTVSGEDNHLHRWHPQSQKFVQMHLADANSSPVKVGKPFFLSNHAPIKEDAAGRLWLGTLGQDLLQYDPQQDQFILGPMKGDSWSGDSIYSILCDDDQTLWLGTNEGLLHYDPANQRLIPFTKGDPAGGEPVFGLQQDQRGGIWLQQAFALKRLDPQHSLSTEYIRLPKIGFTTRFRNREKHFVYVGTDPGGNIFWVNPLNHHQFFQYDPKTDSIQTFLMEFAGKTNTWGLNNEAVNRTGLIDQTGLIWLGYNAGLLKAQKGEVAFFSHQIPDQRTELLFGEDPLGNIWIGGASLSLFSSENKAIRLVSDLVPEIVRSENLPVYFLFYDQEQNLWFYKGGLFRMGFQDDKEAFVNLALGKPIEASSVQGIPMHLPDYAVDGDMKTRWSSEASDPQWLDLDLEAREYIDHIVLHWEACYATHFEILISDDGKNWRKVYATVSGQGEKELISIQEWGRYLRLAGSQRSNPWCYSLWEWEVYRKTPGVKTFIPFPENPRIFPIGMLEDRQGKIWMLPVFAEGGGLMRFEPSTEEFTLYPFQEFQESIGLDLQYFTMVVEDQHGMLWLQDNSGYVLRFNLSNEEFSLFQEPGVDSTTFTSYRLLGKDQQGDMWLSREQGVFRYQSENRALDYFTDFPIIENAFLPDSKGRIWLGSESNGLYLIDPTNGQVKNYDTEDGLAFNKVHNLQEDDQDRLWIGTERGLSCFFPEEERFENYYMEDGLFGNKILSSFKDSQGRLYFGGPGGFSFFDPAELQADSTQTQLVISELKINNQTIDPGTEDSPLSRLISETKSLNLAHDQNVITLGFTALHYNQSEKNRYQVRLLGLDTTWVDLGTQRSMNYAGLSPGSYTFQVKGSNADGVWSEEPTELQITIRPPWWRSPLAYLFYVLLLLTGIYAFIRWRTDSLRRQRELLRKRVSEQTQELRVAKEAAESANEAKSTFLSTVSHELRTPLTSVIGFAKINKKRLEERVLPQIDPQDSKTQKTLGRISQNNEVIISEGERLTSLINELLDLAKIESGKVEWKMVELQPKELIERAVNATSALFEQKPSLKLITDVPEDLPNITGDRDRLLQVLINLISNAVKFTDSGHVTLAVNIPRLNAPPLQRGARVSDGQSEGPFEGAAVPIAIGTTGDVLFTVSDTGSGIPADQLVKVFERFQQVEDNQTGKPKGTGLGLPICKQIVEHHGGKIWVESELGVGSAFWVRLPI